MTEPSIVTKPPCQEQPLSSISRPEREEERFRRAAFDLLNNCTTKWRERHWREQYNRLACLGDVVIEQVKADVKEGLQKLVTHLDQNVFIKIIPPGKMDRPTARRIHALQESVILSPDERFTQRYRPSYLEADSASEIMNKSSNKGTWYITLCDADSETYAYYSHQIVSGEDLRQIDKKLPKALKPEGLYDVIKDLPVVSLNHELAIKIPRDEDVPEVIDQIRPAISAMFNALALGIEYRKDAVLSLARCRSWNAAIESHLDSGWEQLDPQRFHYDEEVPNFPFESTEEQDSILWNTPSKKHMNIATRLLDFKFNESTMHEVTFLSVRFD